jgi:hypothetical protein
VKQRAITNFTEYINKYHPEVKIAQNYLYTWRKQYLHHNLLCYSSRYHRLNRCLLKKIINWKVILVLLFLHPIASGVILSSDQNFKNISRNWMCSALFFVDQWWCGGHAF